MSLTLLELVKASRDSGVGRMPYLDANGRAKVSADGPRFQEPQVVGRSGVFMAGYSGNEVAADIYASFQVGGMVGFVNRIKRTVVGGMPHLVNQLGYDLVNDSTGPSLNAGAHNRLNTPSTVAEGFTNPVPGYVANINTDHLFALGTFLWGGNGHYFSLLGTQNKIGDVDGVGATSDGSSVLGGTLNQGTGLYFAIAGGYQNKNQAPFALMAGDRNVNTGSSSLVVGTQNINTGFASIVMGQQNQANGGVGVADFNLLTGTASISTARFVSILSGRQCFALAEHELISGRDGRGNNYAEWVHGINRGVSGKAGGAQWSRIICAGNTQASRPWVYLAPDNSNPVANPTNNARVLVDATGLLQSSFGFTVTLHAQLSGDSAEGADWAPIRGSARKGATSADTTVRARGGSSLGPVTPEDAWSASGGPGTTTMDDITLEILPDTTNGGLLFKVTDPNAASRSVDYTLRIERDITG